MKKTKPRAKRTSPAQTHRNPIPPKGISGPFGGHRPPLQKGAFGKKRATIAAKNRLLASSCAQANELTSARRLERAYRDFYATPEGRKFAREFGKQYSDSAPHRNGAQCASDPAFCDPADLPAASIEDHPVDHIEPQSDAVEIDGLSDARIKMASEIFGEALRWSLGDPYIEAIVTRGKRSVVMIACMRPDLAADKVDKSLCTDFLGQFGGRLPDLEASGQLFGRKLEWMRRCDSFSSYGERLDIAAYMLRPDLLPASTLAKLGEILNKSRQAKDKLANCARDTFAGLKAPPMRNDITRARCRASQLQILN